MIASKSEAMSSRGWNAALLQAVDVGLGEYAALPCHRVQLQAQVPHVAELFRGNPHLGIDLVNDRARAARALVIHRGDFLLAAGLGVFLEDDDLGILPAQFHHRTAFGIKLLDGERNGVHFLDKFGANVGAHRPAAAARHENAALPRLDAGVCFHALQEFQTLFRLLGVVALIVAPDDLVRRGVHHHGFHRGRADIKADDQVLGICFGHHYAPQWQSRSEGSGQMGS